jgi:hypothetical protein
MVGETCMSQRKRAVEEGTMRPRLRAAMLLYLPPRGRYYRTILPPGPDRRLLLS